MISNQLFLNKKKKLQSIVVGFALCFFTIYSVSHFLAAGRDDTFIMLWEGQTLGYAPWFVNFNYQVQEISSSVLGVLVAALTKGMTVPHALLLIKLLGLTSSLITLTLLWFRRTVLYAEIPSMWLLAFGALVSTAVSPCFQYWTLGGLETPYHALLLLAFCLILVNSLSDNIGGKVDWRLAGIEILLFLTRTEGFWPILMAGVICILLKRCISVHISTVRAL